MKLLFVSLGCDKNLVDSEVMLGLIRDRGWEITDDENEAEAVVVNTCCFIHDAKEESINTLIEIGELKKTGKVKVLVAAGCLAQRYHDEIKEELPEVDAIIGTTAYEHIVEAVETAWNGKNYEKLEELSYLPKNETTRITTTGGHYAYLKIAEGCDKHCTYCIIPKIRGDFRSVPMEKLLEEASYLALNGVKELILVAQETTLYGKDIYGEKKLPELLRELCKISGLEWIRLLYCYPEEITDELIQVIREENKICNYLDMPIQHCADSILKRMGRRTSKAELVEIVTRLRREIPDICLRTTLITGFPGETEEDHKELLDFVDAMEFDRLGVFTYSPEENTAAAKMENQIDEKVKCRRQQELMELQQEIAFEKAEDSEGRRLMVMIEGSLPEDGVYIGRTYKDAPKVDGYIFVNSERELLSGELVPVYVTDAKDYDLIGELIQ
ncbi:30S ribosomal protein S12 methylthiotransferase RimO [Acetivibrio ethanolgignens]|uniref:Ribosomal protein uS12 methylthiotransferase RimO n=1 Tax=Acetivibrio ethanolgignens TaxID=290052 RepID=A0A0V8QHN1_9FIRM|nr:30S ribosomal protein S12 methylthiotransferase RimO [Acetivibrio ethanolgignens]KSV60079.1 ribosomal protein S12 methylthiotransferase RimO [Acetivibrio ethanolgignens]